MSEFWAREKSEIIWLQANPQFDMRPATIREFVGPTYLNEPNVRPGIMKALIDVFGEKIDPEFISIKRKACVTGGIGIGKTTFASIALSYMVHWVSCLRDPQGYFNLAKGSRISFMMMSTSQKQAKEVIFGDVKARINNSPWFKRHCMYNTKFENQLRFPKDIWIVPGGSKETQFEGYNILAGILDEGDSHTVTKEKDYADEGWNTIDSRIASRFVDHVNETTKGLLIAIGQMKSAVGFMSRKYKDIQDDPEGVVLRMAIWESFGWYNYTEDKADATRKIETSPRKSFYFDTKRKEVIPKSVAGGVINENMIEIPIAYAPQFAKNPVKALRDLAGIPPASEDPFISYTHLIEAAQDAWIARYGDRMPMTTSADQPWFEDWFRADENLRRTLHIDIAYSANGDALGLAMGHIPELIDQDGELKPFIVIDCIIRMKAKAGTQNDLSLVRKMVYYLKDDLGFNIKSATLDGFNSTDTIQQFNKRHINSYPLSVDKTKAPYEDLRDAIVERRIALPRQMVQLNWGEGDLVDIVYKELSELTDTGQKIDHPKMGSKDVADGIAGVVGILMDDKTFQRGSLRPVQNSNEGTAKDLENFFNNGAKELQNPVDFDTFSNNPDQFLAQPKTVVPSVDYAPFDLRNQIPARRPGGMPRIL